MAEETEEVQEETEEEIEEEVQEEKKVKKKKRLRISNRGLAVLTGGIILITGGVFKLVHYKNYEVPLDIDSSITNLVNNDSSKTISNNTNEQLLMEMNFLDGATSVYTKLNSIDLEKYDKGLTRIPVTSIEEDHIDKLLVKYNKLLKGDIKTPSKNSIEFYNVVNELLSYKEALTEQRFVDGIESINEFANIVVNANVFDTLDEDLDYQSVSTNLYDFDADGLEIHYITDSNIDFYLKTSYFCDLQYFADELRELNELKVKYLNGEMTNIKKLIEKENKVIRFIKTCIYSDYSIKNGVISQYEGHLDIKKKINVK